MAVESVAGSSRPPKLGPRKSSSAAQQSQSPSQQQSQQQKTAAGTASPAPKLALRRSSSAANDANANANASSNDSASPSSTKIAGKDIAKPPKLGPRKSSASQTGAVSSASASASRSSAPAGNCANNATKTSSTESSSTSKAATGPKLGLSKIGEIVDDQTNTAADAVSSAGNATASTLKKVQDGAGVQKGSDVKQQDRPRAQERKKSDAPKPNDGNVRDEEKEEDSGDKTARGNRQQNEDAQSSRRQPPKGLPKLGPRAENQSKGQNQEKDAKPQQCQPSSKNDESLTTILNSRQRTQLIILLAAATATMRENLSNVFEAMGGSSYSLKQSANMTEDEKIMNADVDPGSADVAAHDRERKMLAQHEKEVSMASMQELRAAAEDWFDTWRETIIGRVGEVLTSAKEAKSELSSGEAEAVKPTTEIPKERKIEPGQSQSGGSLGDVEVVLRTLCPPVKTSLVNLDEEKRVLILHSVLLLVLSTEHYASVSRVLLLFLMSSLDLSLEKLKVDEDKTAHGLLESAKELSGSYERKQKVDSNERARKWKVGLASVAGAAIIGVTGGMAAPMVAAGVGSVMGGLGLGATAAAGYLGSVAGSSMLVGSLFGAYGGRMTGQMMENYAKEVSDFGFVPVHSDKKHLLDSRGKGADAESDAGKKDPSSRRLRVTIGITGWLVDKEEVVKPWSVLSNGSEAFALRWELEALLNLGNSMTELMSSAAWGYAQKQLISRTIFADLAGAMWPLALVKAARVVDNPFSVAKSRAEKAGEVLADALINHAQGERPVNLIGYSLGARVIYTCLKTLANRKAFGLIENVVLIGAPLPSESVEWRRMRAMVAGRLVNVFSENDYVLSFLYRTSSAQYNVAGLRRIKGVAGVENIDVSDTVSGHLRYRFMVGSILKKIGFEDLDLKEVEKEEHTLKKMDEEEQKRMDDLKDKIPSRSSKKAQKKQDENAEADAEKEADKMEKHVQERTQASMMQRGAELLHLRGSDKTEDAEGKESHSMSSSYLSYVTPGWLAKNNDCENKEAAAAQNEEASTKPATGSANSEDKSPASKAWKQKPGLEAAKRRGSVKDKPSPRQKKSSRPSSPKDSGASEESSYMQKAAAAMPSLSTRWRN